MFRSVSTAHNFLLGRFRLYRRLDKDNQLRGPAAGQARASGKLTRKQLESLTEGILISASRDFELFMHEIFFLYCVGATTRSGKAVSSYLNVRDKAHAMEIVKGNARFLDWNDSQQIISRCEKFFGGSGGPMKKAVQLNQATLNDIRFVRNFIAHGEKGAERAYNDVLRRRFGTAPIKIMPAGAFLLNASAVKPAEHILIEYLTNLQIIADGSTK